MNKLLLSLIVSLALVGCAGSAKAPVASAPAPAADKTAGAAAAPSVAQVAPKPSVAAKVAEAPTPAQPAPAKKAPVASVLWQASALAKPQFKPVAEPKPELLWSSSAEPSAKVNSIAYSPDGEKLASALEGGQIKLWDARSGELLRTLEGHTSDVRSVAFAPDGNTLASGSEDKTIKLWDARSGALLRTLEGHTHWVESVAFAPDGKTLASGSLDKTIKLWDARSGEVLRTLNGHTSYVGSVAFAPDGKTLASGSEDRTIKLWDARSGELLRTLEGHTGNVISVAFAPDGQTLASGSIDKTVKLWGARSGKLVRTLEEHTSYVHSVAFAPDGKTLASSSGDTTIKLWGARSGELLRTLEGHKWIVNSVAFAPDGNTLASGSWDKTIKTWDARSSELQLSIDARGPDHERKGHRGLVRSVAFAPDGNTLASGSYDTTIKLWDARSGEILRTLEGHTSGVLSVAFVPDGNTLASSSLDTTIKLWDAHGGEVLRTLEGHTNEVRSVVFAPDGKRLASGSGDKTIKLWDARSGALLRTLEGHTSAVRSVAFAPDGSTLASVSWDNAIKLWDARSGETLRTLESHTGSVRSVAFAPDGQTLASGSWDNTIKLWDVSSGELLRTLEGHTDSVVSVAFAPDGKTLTSGSWDNTIKLWDARSGELLHTLEGHRADVISVAFTPDGQALASSSGDKTVKLWRVPARERAWNAFVADYSAGAAGLPELERLQGVYPEFQRQYKLLAAYTESQQQFQRQYKLLAAYTEIQQLAATADKPAAIQAYVEARLQDYSAADYEIAPIATDVPQRGEYPQLPLTVKDEYEKTATFQARGQKAEAEYRAQVARIDADYERAIAAYNAEIERYNSDLAAAQAQRVAQLATKRREFIGEAMALAYGAPQITNTEYDADDEVFFAELVGASGGFTEKVKIPVPIGQARALGENNQEAQVAVRFVERAGGVLSLDDVRVAFRKQEYSGELTRENYQFVAEVSTVDAQPANDQRLALLSVTDAPQAINVDDYFIETLKLENDPAAERVLAEIAAEKERALALQRERQQAALRQQLEDQLAELRQSNRGVADPQIARAVATMPAAETNARTWLLAIGVEDYKEAPDVPYADNSLELVSAALAKRFGIPEANRVVLQGEEATGTFIRGKIRNTLRLLGPEDTLYFYYSGHGMPGRNGEQLYLAPRDIVVSAFEDEDFAFANLLGEIQQARVGKVLAFLDTCFSGKAKVDELVFPGVAPIMESAEQELPDKMTVFYAASGAQFANSYDDKGHRLFSYFLAQGLADGLGTVEDLGRYVSANVAEQARAKGAIYEQVPFVDGRGGKL